MEDTTFTVGGSGPGSGLRILHVTLDASAEPSLLAKWGCPPESDAAVLFGSRPDGVIDALFG